MLYAKYFFFFAAFAYLCPIQPVNWSFFFISELVYYTFHGKALWLNFHKWYPSVRYCHRLCLQSAHSLFLISCASVSLMKHNWLAIQQLFTCSQETRRSSRIRKKHAVKKGKSRKMRRLHHHHLIFFLLPWVPFTLSERCCAVKEVSSSRLPSMAGRYLLIGHSSALTAVQVLRNLFK